MLLESLVKYLNSGERKIDRWTAQHRCATVVFDEAGAFFNANTATELQALERGDKT
jgi:molybdopterin-guanine dinucleotide biosynthesis protein A